MEVIRLDEISKDGLNTVANNFIDRLVLRLEAMDATSHIAVLAKLGSWAKGEMAKNSDYDLLLICRDSDTFQRVVSAIAEAEKELLTETGVLVTAFTSFRTEELHRALVKEPYCLIHLLIYPSQESFPLWESPSVLRSICVGAQLIIGDENWLATIMQSLPIPNRKASLEFLLCQLHNSYVYLMDGQLAKEVSAREGFHKLQYVVRHATTLALKEIGVEAYTWKSIVQNHHKLELASSNVIASVYKARTLSSASRNLYLGRKQLAKLYEKAFRYLYDVKDFMSQEHNRQ